MKILKETIAQACLSILLVLLAAPVWAQAGDNGIFAAVDALMAQANEADAKFLSPDNYEDAQASYAKARDYFEKGRSDKAQAELSKTSAYLNKSIDASKLGKVNFVDTLNARNLALAAEAPKYEGELWEKAEKEFKKAAHALETGNVNKATDKGNTASGYYSDAELAAIKTAIVGKARELIAAADDDKVYREAPITFEKAKAGVKQAEADLDKNRYDTKAPIALAATAEYDARHAAYIASQLRLVDDDKMTEEQLMLDWEKPLQDIAGALDVSTDMSAGYAKSADASVAMARWLVEENVALSAKVAKLEMQVGGNAQIVEETKRLEMQLKAVESLFTQDQARIVRESKNLTLRLVGLSFQTGQSVIETRYFGLLKKVQQAIEYYPNAPIVIEGHTDSVGSDAVNMKLSQDRAESVREYLIANLGLPESRVSAIGYGKDRPIASNETNEGRAQNRRIDVVIVNARERKDM